jgi:hypothetical protein
MALIDRGASSLRSRSPLGLASIADRNGDRQEFVGKTLLRRGKWL